MSDTLTTIAADLFVLIVIVGLCAIPILIVLSAISTPPRPTRYTPRRRR